MTVLYEVADRVATITVNRPEAMNALDAATMAALSDTVQMAGAAADVGAVVLTGAGVKAFIAGADIRQFPELSPAGARRLSEEGMAVTFLVESLAKPVLAAVNGFALGGGCEMALACDFIYAAHTARFGQPEVKLGLVPGYGGTQRLARRIGRARAFELIATGEMIDAARALALGLVNAVFAADELMTKAHETAAKMAAGAPRAIAEAKRLIRDGLELPLRAACALESEAFAGLFGTADQREGARAFLEKRPPKFKGE
ncbi:MAG TPA: enoyl-CoA hydratase-related protein [Myxococcota bacterium]|jgi:enoyl-CoA hydratase|nr:enoyl-CoA hydratase-related protein [Myxococcota bacterium]